MVCWSRSDAYVAPSCILYGISCSIIHDTVTSMMHVRPYTALTHMHALDSMHALYVGAALPPLTKSDRRC